MPNQPSAIYNVHHEESAYAGFPLAHARVTERYLTARSATPFVISHDDDQPCLQPIRTQPHILILGTWLS
jgi:hypothetical protein